MSALDVIGPRELNDAFADLEPGETYIYWMGENLARDCCDWERDLQKKSAKSTAALTQKVRDWAADKQQYKRGFLTQEKFGNIYHYRITKAKEKGPRP